MADVDSEPPKSLCSDSFEWRGWRQLPCEPILASFRVDAVTHSDQRFRLYKFRESTAQLRGASQSSEVPSENDNSFLLVDCPQDSLLEC